MDNKETLRQAAEIIFSSKGYHATSIRNIAQYAHANTSIVMYHIKSKENLLLEIIEKLDDAVENINTYINNY